MLAAARVGKPASERAAWSTGQEQLLKAEEALEKTSPSERDMRDGGVVSERPEKGHHETTSSGGQRGAGEYAGAACPFCLCPLIC